MQRWNGNCKGRETFSYIKKTSEKQIVYNLMDASYKAEKGTKKGKKQKSTIQGWGNNNSWQRKRRKPYHIVIYIWKIKEKDWGWKQNRGANYILRLLGISSRIFLNVKLFHPSVRYNCSLLDRLQIRLRVQISCIDYFKNWFSLYLLSRKWYIYISRSSILLLSKHPRKYVNYIWYLDCYNSRIQSVLIKQQGKHVYF